MKPRLKRRCVEEWEVCSGKCSSAFIISHGLFYPVAGPRGLITLAQFGGPWTAFSRTDGRHMASGFVCRTTDVKAKRSSSFPYKSSAYRSDALSPSLLFFSVFRSQVFT
ncbi:hypothetical protein QQF64_002924 [Cirrhinus molitorella]|uniref:Uncharacterized protein n=1 Tax=Cirrhinus molitorella TaxID=172907 RepID=A0ABR3MRJ9_9TELE